MIEKVDVVLLGLKSEGTLYLSGDGDLDLPIDNKWSNRSKTYRWIFT